MNKVNRRVRPNYPAIAVGEVQIIQRPECGTNNFLSVDDNGVVTARRLVGSYVRHRLAHKATRNKYAKKESAK